MYKTLKDLENSISIMPKLRTAIEQVSLLGGDADLETDGLITSIYDCTGAYLEEYKMLTELLLGAVQHEIYKRSRAMVEGFGHDDAMKTQNLKSMGHNDKEVEAILRLEV